MCQAGVQRRRTDSASLEKTAYFRQRCHLYDALRRGFFLEPDERSVSFWHLFCREAPPPGAPTIMRDGYDDMNAHFSSHAPLSNEQDKDSLHWEFTRLFIGPMPPEAPPWASCYLEPDGLLFQETTLWVRTRYQAHGFMAGEHVNAEADDHIGIEFDFLYRLGEETVQALEEGGDPEVLRRLLQDQLAFLSAHLLRFVDRFRRRVEDRAALPYYRGMARIAQGFVESDKNAVEEMLNGIASDKEASNG